MHKIYRTARTNYVIILAMEASEIHHRSKSENLREHFKDGFLQFVITNHPSDLPGEARGKGSNISYGARKGTAEMIANGIDKNRIIITICDSDSHIPELYVSEVIFQPILLKAMLIFFLHVGRKSIQSFSRSLLQSFCSTYLFRKKLFQCTSCCQSNRHYMVVNDFSQFE